MAENKKITTVEDYLANIPEKNREIAQALRLLIKKTIPRASEKIMWSMPWYKVDDKQFAVIMSSTHHVGFGYRMGAHLKSPLLEGTGKDMRHVKIKSIEDFKEKEKELTRLLKEAEKLG